MPEVLVNDYTTTLASALSAGAGPSSTFTVAGGISATYVGQTARVRVDSEILVVTFTSSTLWTVVTRAAEDSDRFPAASHGIGAPVDVVLTAAGLGVDLGTGNTLWVDPVNGTTAGVRGRPDKPFSTPTSAKAAALSGDAVRVRPGTYANNNLLANGVNWHFEEGAAVATSAAGATGIFDDSGGAVVSTVGGFGKFSVTGSANQHLVNVANSGTTLLVSADTITAAGGLQIGIRAVSQTAGTLAVRCRELVATGTTATALWWGGGEAHVSADRISGPSNAVYADTSATSGNLWVTADRIECTGTGNPAVYVFAGGDNARVWLDAKEVRSEGLSGVNVAGGRLYLRAEKLSAANSALAMTDGKLWATVQKLSHDAGGGGSSVALATSGSQCWANVKQVEDLGINAGPLLTLSAASGAVIDFQADEVVCGANADGVSLGANATFSGRIDATAAAARNPVVLTASGGTLRNAVLLAASGRYCVTSSSPRTVTVEGTLTVNGDIDPNVTLVFVPQRAGIHSGTLIVRQPGGVAGTDECQVSHNGTNTVIASKDGKIRFEVPANLNPGFEFVGGSNAMWYAQQNAGHMILFLLNASGNTKFHVDTSAESVRLATGGNYGWSNNSGDAWQTLDTSMRRAAPGVVQLAAGSSSLPGTASSVAVTPSALGADQNDYNPGVGRRYRLSTTGGATRTVTGLSIGQADGQEFSVVNLGPNNVVLAHQNAGSSAANRFICTGAANITLATDEEALVWYDATTQRFRARKV